MHWVRFKAFGSIAALCLLGACAQMKVAGAESPAVVSKADAYGSYLAGRLAASEHDMTEAAKLYRETVAHDPADPDVLSHALLYTAAAGDIDEAARLADRVIVSQPDDRIARLTLSVDALKHGDFAEARSQIEKSGKGAFTALTLSLLDAWAAEGEGKTDAALASLKNVTTEGGTAALNASHRALILDLAGRNSDADAAYREALALAPSSPRMVEAYGRFLERTNRATDARAFYAKFADNSALAPIVRAGEARLADGRTPDRMVASAQAGAAESLFGIAASLSEDASADVAILYLRYALYLSPDFDLAKIVLADRFEALKKYDDAIAIYRGISPDSDYRFAAAVQIAIDENRLDRNDEAISELTALTREKPKDLTAWTALGDAYRTGKKYDLAAAAYNRAVGLLDPVTKKDWPLFYARGVSEERSHRWDAAEQDLQHALKLSPDQPQVLNYLGYSWVDRGQELPQALAMLEKARALDPNDGYIVDSVGWAYFRLGRYRDAAKTLEKAVLLVPGDPTINEHLGDAYWMVGRTRDARFQWNHAIAFGAKDEQKAEIEKKLVSGLSASDRQAADASQ